MLTTKYAALRDTLFAVAAQELGIVWLISSNSQKIQCFLHDLFQIPDFSQALVSLKKISYIVYYAVYMLYLLVLALSTLAFIMHFSL